MAKTKHIHLIGSILLGILIVIIYFIGLNTPTENVKITTDAKIQLTSGWINSDTGEKITEERLEIAPTECVRIKQRLPENLGDGEIMGFYDRGFHIMAYVNGYAVYESGVATYNNLGEEVGAVWRTLTLGADMSGQYILLALENNTDSPLTFEMSRIYIGSSSDIVAMIVKTSGISFLVCFICFVMVIVLGVLCVNLKRIGNVAYFKQIHPLMVLTAFVGLWVFADSSMLQIRQSNASIRYYLTFMSFILIPLALNFYYINNMDHDRLVMRIMSAIYKYAISLCFLFYLFHVVHISNTIFMVHAYLLCEAYVIARNYIKEIIKERNTRTISNIVALAIMVAFLVVGMCLYYTSKRNKVSAMIGVGYVLFLMTIFITQVRKITMDYNEYKKKQAFKDIASVDGVTKGNSRWVAEEWLEKDSLFAEGNPWLVHMRFVDFSFVNANFGWEHGNEIIKAIYEKNLSCIDSDELEAAVGDGTYAFIVKAERNIDDFCIALQRCLDEYIAEEWAGLALPVIFCATKIHKGEIFGTLLDHCGIAMASSYATYNKESNCYYYSDACREQIRKEFNLETRIGAGIVTGEFETKMIPKVDAVTEKIVGAQSTLIWNHPEYGSLLPKEYVPIAIRSGQIRVVAQYLFRQNCEFAARRRAAGLRDISVSILASADHLRRENIFDEYKTIIEDTHAPVECIQFEIMEEMTNDFLPEIRSLIAEAHKNGCKVVLTGFGRGTTNVEAVCSLEFDEIYLDNRFFTYDLKKGTREYMLIKGMVELFHAMGMKVTAQRITRESQLMDVRSIGIDYVQDYFGKEMIAMSEMENE